MPINIDDLQIFVRERPPLTSDFRRFLFDILLDIFDIFRHSLSHEDSRAFSTGTR